jgi:hypothetical protein
MKFLLVIESPKIFITTMTFKIAVVTLGTYTFLKCSVVISTVKSITDLISCVRLHNCLMFQDHASSWISNTTKLSFCKCRNSIVSGLLDMSLRLFLGQAVLPYAYKQSVCFSDFFYSSSYLLHSFVCYHLEVEKYAFGYTMLFA